MSHSRFENGMTGRLAAKSYLDGKEVRAYPLRDLPAGGLNTTVVDLARLAMLINNNGSLENRPILKPRTLNQMFEVQNNGIEFDCGSKTGLAWFIDEDSLAAKEPVYWHNGGLIAHRATFMVVPRSKIGVVVMADTGFHGFG